MKKYLTLLAMLCLFATNGQAQKWKYDFIVPDNGNFRQAINAANTRADKSRRYRIFIRSSNYRILGEGNIVTTLTAPNTSIIGEQWQNTQVESCPKEEGISNTSTLFLQNADSTYIQDIELWSNYRNDPKAFANRAVSLREQNCKGNILKNISLLGTQDTYYTNAGGTTYVEDARICGTVDFICGGGTVYFNHCEIKLMSRGDSTKRDIICAPATEADHRYGYVFSDCYIDGPKHQSGRYLLGRPWKNAPRAAFLNCCMNIVPTPEGWTDMHGTLPARFAEFECTNGLFELLDTSRRKTTFKNAEGQEVRMNYTPQLTSEEAETYTITKVFNGWDPQAKTAQVPPPVLHINGRELTWEDNPDAGCYVVFRDRVIVAFVTEPRYQIPANTREGSCYTIRCANQMGGLGLRSAEAVYSRH